MILDIAGGLATLAAGTAPRQRGIRHGQPAAA
jgi:hypothetical protein